jgi:hypothetical protein
MTALKGLHDVGYSRVGERVLVGVRDKIVIAVTALRLGLEREP